MKRIVEEMDQTTRPATDDMPYVSTPEQRVDNTKVAVRLIEIILNMPETDQRNLLVDLEHSYAVGDSKQLAETRSFSEEMRQHPRKKSIIAADCTSNEICFLNFIKDISNGGVFIETNAPFYIGQQIKMNFSLPKMGDNISVAGEVVRVNSEGIGVKFTGGDTEKLDIKE
jgi:type IV pilus assembly protein PilZ